MRLLAVNGWGLQIQNYSNFMSLCWQIFYSDLDSSEEAAAYKARIIEDTWNGREDAVLQNPYGCGSLWERFFVQWDPPVFPAGLRSPLCNMQNAALVVAPLNPPNTFKR